MPIYGEWHNGFAHRRCHAKKVFRRTELAEKAAQRLSIRLGHLLIAYKCYDCGKYHVGHADQSQWNVRPDVEAHIGLANKAKEAVQAELLRQAWVCCANCKGPISDERKALVIEGGGLPTCCSKKCSNKWRKKKRHAARNRMPH